MNKRIKKEWLKALRGGDYDQAIEALHGREGFCCLGVLCDIYGKKEGVEWGDEFDERSMHEKRTFLPSEVMEWAALGEEDPTIPSMGMNRITLSNLNDDGKTFEEIADVIEAEF